MSMNKMDEYEVVILNERVSKLEDAYESVDSRVDQLECKQEVSYTIFKQIEATLCSIEKKLTEHIEKEGRMLQTIILRVVGGLSIVVFSLIGYIFMNLI